MKKIILLFFILNYHPVFSQNLVPNPGFEDTSGCAATIWPGLPCANWYSANDSPDYYTNSYSCTAGQYPLDYQNPRTGLSYVGMYFWQLSCVREYIGVKLTQPLISGNEYCLEFYYSRHESYAYATNRIGAYFSTDTAYIPPIPCNLTFTPQISTAYTNPPLQDTLNWILFSGSYIASGGEEFLTIGNLFSDDSTVAAFIGGPYNCAYYFIDDVSLINCSAGAEELNSNYQISVFPDPATNSLNISIDKEGMYEIVIYDLAGRKMLTETIEREKKISTTSLAKGGYVYEIRKKSALIGQGKFVL